MSHFSFKMFHPRKDERIHQVLQVHHKMPYGLSTASDKARSLQASGEQPPGLTPVSSHPTSGSFIDKIRKVSTFKVYFLHCKKLHSLKIKMNKISLCTDGDNLIFWICAHSPVHTPALFWLVLTQSTSKLLISTYFCTALKTTPFPFPTAHRKQKKKAIHAPVAMKRRKYSHADRAILTGALKSSPEKSAQTVDFPCHHQWCWRPHTPGAAKTESKTGEKHCPKDSPLSWLQLAGE